MVISITSYEVQMLYTSSLQHSSSAKAVGSRTASSFKLPSKHKTYSMAPLLHPAKLGKRPIRVVALAFDFCALYYRSLRIVYLCTTEKYSTSKRESFVYVLSPSKVQSDLVLTHTPLSSRGPLLFFPETKNTLQY